MFNEAATPYQDALFKSGYTYKLEFKPLQRAPPQRLNRSRKIIWFDPPCNNNVKCKIGRDFLRLIDKCFPAGHKLRKIFNRNTLKLSYSCMPNVQQIIKGHNKTVLKNSAQPAQDQAERECNCKKKEECPLEGNCLAKGIDYQAQVTAAGKTETYVGLTSTEFKARFRNHQVSFNNEARKNDTELSLHIWQLKSKEQRFTIKWKILAKAKPLFQPDKAMQSMQSGEAFHHNQTGNGNIKQTKRTNFYMPAPTKVHPQIWLTNCISFLQRAHTSTQ